MQGNSYEVASEETLERALFHFLNERSSPGLWTPKSILRFCSELERFHPQVLEANPSYLARFSREVARLGTPLAEPKVIVFTYENPSLLHLRQIRRVFRAPFVFSYGSTAGASCPCGRNGAALVTSIEGRVKSLTRTVEGRPVTQGELDRLLAVESSLVTYQLVQDGVDRYTLKAVLEVDEGNGAPDRLRDALVGLYGKAASVRREVCGDLEPEASGKFLLAKGLPVDSRQPRVPS